MIGKMKKAVKIFIPNSMINYYYFYLLKRKFPGRKIESSKIYGNVEIGDGVVINKDVTITDGVKIGNYSYINSGNQTADSMK